MSETKEVAVQTPGQLMLTKEHEQTLMDSANFSDVRDILLPKVLAMQGLSKKVAAELARQGEMRDSIENKLLGDRNNPFEIIPFYITKSWILFHEVDGKMEYKGQVPFGPENANWEWEIVVDKVKHRRDQSLNVYCLDPREIEEGMFLPYLISFRRTSYKGGKKLITAKEKMRMANRALATKTFKVSTVQETNEKGIYYVFDVAMGRDTTQKEIEAVLPWAELVRTSQVKVDDSDLHEETGTTGSAPVDANFSGNF
jgi:hypothetical protein